MFFRLLFSFFSVIPFTASVITSITISQNSDGQPQVPTPTAILSPAPEQSTCLPNYQPIHLRYPPTLSTSIDKTWVPPPPAWIYGNWKIIASSRPTYHQLYNFQHDCYPVLPINTSVTSGLQVDLTSWNLAPSATNATLNSTILTAFGYDTPVTTVAPSVFRFNGTGYLATVSNEWEITSWGYDTNGIGYRTEYETAAAGAGGPCINILSRSEKGPSPATLSDIFAALHEVYTADTDLLGLAKNVTKLVIDGRRTGQAPVACSIGCMDNIDLV